MWRISGFVLLLMGCSAGGSLGADGVHALAVDGAKGPAEGHALVVLKCAPNESGATVALRIDGKPVVIAADRPDIPPFVVELVGHGPRTTYGDARFFLPVGTYAIGLNASKQTTSVQLEAKKTYTLLFYGSADDPQLKMWVDNQDPITDYDFPVHIFNARWDRQPFGVDYVSGDKPAVTLAKDVPYGTDVETHIVFPPDQVNTFVMTGAEQGYASFLANFFDQFTSTRGFSFCGYPDSPIRD
jgi:hypothetical protein